MLCFPCKDQSLILDRYRISLIWQERRLDNCSQDGRVDITGALKLSVRTMKFSPKRTFRLLVNISNMEYVTYYTMFC
ncbi:hypothetical protein HanXRQr2_Chr13g0568541 [Helianthus annuus]|nr:hypothetical protein HanXRQr2_Chr13g0568541 [Helianthus annuus]KAJ0496284.1 hypothetical protein HanHA89_Chr13g0497921 [Helianthus annuus]